MTAFPLLPVDAFPWIVVAAIATRFAFHVVRTQHLRAQLRVTEERLADALSRLELEAALAKADATRVMLACEAPQVEETRSVELAA